MSDVDELFPAVDPGVKPLGSRVLVQIRIPRKKSRGGILLTEEDRATERDNTQVAKVVATGPLSFHNRDSGVLWPEGAWCQPGQFVRVPKYGGDRWQVKHGEESVNFALFNDLDLLGVVTDDPTATKAFF